MACAGAPSTIGSAGADKDVDRESAFAMTAWANRAELEAAIGRGALRACRETNASIPIWTRDTTMAGAGRPPTALLRPTLGVGDGGLAPAMTVKIVCLAPADSVTSRQALRRPPLSGVGPRRVPRRARPRYRGIAHSRGARLGRPARRFSVRIIRAAPGAR